MLFEKIRIKKSLFPGQVILTAWTFGTAQVAAIGGFDRDTDRISPMNDSPGDP
jgi:hypothetical protein